MAKSRPKRWAEAVQKAKTALADLREALEQLQSIQEEYSEWCDKLPENLESSPVADKLSAIADIEIEGALEQIEEIEGVVYECDNAELPMGFGRD